MSEGAFQTDRLIFENKIWKQILKFRLFFFIYGNAVFSESGIDIGEIHLNRGQFLRSYRGLQSDLEYIENHAVKRYSLSQIKNAVDELVKEKRLIFTTTSLGTLFTVCNYEQYQGFERFSTGSIEQRKNTVRTLLEQRKNNNKKDNNDKKDKNVLNTNPLEAAIDDFKEYRKKIRKPMTDRAVELLKDKLSKLTPDDDTKIAILNQSVVNGWQGIFPLKDDAAPQQAKSSNPFLAKAKELQDEQS